MSLYHYQYEQKEIPQYNRIKRIYFLFGVTLGLFLFIMLLPVSIFFTSKTVASPISSDTQVKKEVMPTSTPTPSPTPLPTVASAKAGYPLDDRPMQAGNISP